MDFPNRHLADTKLSFLSRRRFHVVQLLGIEQDYVNYTIYISNCMVQDFDISFEKERQGKSKPNHYDWDELLIGHSMENSIGFFQVKTFQKRILFRYRTILKRLFLLILMNLYSIDMRQSWEIDITHIVEMNISYQRSLELWSTHGTRSSSLVIKTTFLRRRFETV